METEGAKPAMVNKEKVRKQASEKNRVLKTFLTVGPTRMGKSSLVNALA